MLVRLRLHLNPRDQQLLGICMMEMTTLTLWHCRDTMTHKQDKLCPALWLLVQSSYNARPDQLVIKISPEERDKSLKMKWTTVAGRCNFHVVLYIYNISDGIKNSRLIASEICSSLFHFLPNGIVSRYKDIDSNSWNALCRQANLGYGYDSSWPSTGFSSHKGYSSG